jgi:hypothetical protein
MAYKTDVTIEMKRKVRGEMNAISKAAEDAQDKQTFDSVIAVLKIIAVIICIAGTLYNYGNEVAKYFENPTSASASAEKK